MVMKKKSTPVKKLGDLIVMMSTTLLDSFFSDEMDKRLAKERSKGIRDVLQEAAHHKQLVVLQIATPKPDKVEFLSGWIVGKNVGSEQLVLKLQKDAKQMKIIAIADIQKVSVSHQQRTVV